MLISDHFATERKRIRIYKVIYYVCFLFLELLIIIAPIVSLSRESESQTGNRIGLLLLTLSLLRTILVTLWFTVVLYRMQREIRRSYRWLLQDYFWRIIVIGVAVSLALFA